MPLKIEEWPTSIIVRNFLIKTLAEALCSAFLRGGKYNWQTKEHRKFIVREVFRIFGAEIQLDSKMDRLVKSVLEAVSEDSQVHELTVLGKSINESDSGGRIENEIKDRFNEIVAKCVQSFCVVIEPSTSDLPPYLLDLIETKDPNQVSGRVASLVDSSMYPDAKITGSSSKDWSGDWTLLSLCEKIIDGGMYPKIQNLIESQLAYADYIKSKPKSLFIRGFKEFRSRSLIHRINGCDVAISDNEACCGFFQEMYKKSWAKQDIFKWFRVNEIGISGGKDAPGPGYTFQKAEDIGLKVKINKGFPFRSSYDLKLSHILPAASFLPSNTSLEVRAARLLSPFNICLTPKVRRGSNGYRHIVVDGPILRLHRGDIGETDYYLGLMHRIWMERIFSEKDGERAYLAYADVCQAPCSVKSEDFERSKQEAAKIRIQFDGGSDVERPNAPRLITANESVFQRGSPYTIDQITNVLGGSPQPAINTLKGQAKWAKFRCGNGYNPEGPCLLGIHRGRVRESAAMAWVNSPKPIPFFFCLGNSSSFDYLGTATARLVHRGQRASEYAVSRGYPNPDHVELILSVSLNHGMIDDNYEFEDAG